MHLPLVRAVEGCGHISAWGQLCLCTCTWLLQAWDSLSPKSACPGRCTSAQGRCLLCPGQRLLLPITNWAPPLCAGQRSLGGSEPVTIPGCLARSPSLHSSSSLSTSPLSSLSQPLSGPLVSSAMTPPQQPPSLKSEPRVLGSSASTYNSLGELGFAGEGPPCSDSLLLGEPRRERLPPHHCPPVEAPATLPCTLRGVGPGVPPRRPLADASASPTVVAWGSGRVCASASARGSVRDRTAARWPGSLTSGECLRQWRCDAARDPTQEQTDLEKQKTVLFLVLRYSFTGKSYFM